MLENFPHFAAFVLVAHAAGLANDQTALGATMCFWARLTHAIVYIAGIWRLRAPAFFAGVAGEYLVIARLLGLSPAVAMLAVAALATAISAAIFGLRRTAEA